MGGLLPDGRYIRVANDRAPYWGGVRLDNSVFIGTVPDLECPAVLGWMRVLVRRAWGDPSMTLAPVDESIPLAWSWMDDGLEAPMAMSNAATAYARFASEAEGLVAALEEAP
jgi:hypothetical protein